MKIWRHNHALGYVGFSICARLPRIAANLVRRGADSVCLCARSSHGWAKQRRNVVDEQTVFSAGTQLSAAGLLHAGAPAVALIFTAMVLNVHQVLLGFSLGQHIRFTWLQRWLAAYFLNDGAYGVTMASVTPSFLFLLGAELSMFVVWNAATAFGIVVGQWLPDPGRLGVDFVFPLLFLALLIPIIRSRSDLVVVGCAGCAALLFGQVLTSSLTVLTSALVACAVGTWWIGTEDTPVQTVSIEEQL